MTPLRHDHYVWCPKGCTGECYMHVPGDVPDGPLPKRFSVRGYSRDVVMPLKGRNQDAEASRWDKPPSQVSAEDVHYTVRDGMAHFMGWRLDPVPVRSGGSTLDRVEVRHFSEGKEREFFAYGTCRCGKDRRVRLGDWRQGRYIYCDQCPETKRLKRPLTIGPKSELRPDWK